MKTNTRFLALVMVPLLAPAAPVRADAIADVRRSDQVWVDQMAVRLSDPFPSPRPRSNDCDLVRKPGGALALLVNPRRFGLTLLDAWIRLNGEVQPGGFVRWTVDRSSVPGSAGAIVIHSLTGSVDTDVRALEPFEAECNGVLRTYRVRLELRAHRGPAGEDLNRLVAATSLGGATATITQFTAELSTPARPALTLSSVSLPVMRAGSADRPTRVGGTVSLSAEPDGRTYDVTLTARGTPAHSRISIERAPAQFTGMTRSQPFTLLVPAGYYGTVEVTGTGGDGTVRRATVRITDPNAIDPVFIVPEYRRIYEWEILPDPPVDIGRRIDPAARRIAPVTPGLKPGLGALPPSGKAGIPVPQEPFKKSLGAQPLPQSAGKVPVKQVPVPPVKGYGQK